MNDLAVNLARRSTVLHPSGLKVQTPLLIPSFSTKGFRVCKERSEICDALEITSEWLTDSMLISAYDLGHGLIPRPADLSGTPEFIVVDSGGYEKRIEHDLSTAVHWPHLPLEWNARKHTEELDRWPERFAACFVSYDEPGLARSVEEQVQAATELFECYPGQLHTFLLKPTTNEQKYLTTAISDVLAAPHLLRGFQFVGVTESELGPSMLQRMFEVARLRRAMDAAGLATPIHVFGALDPLTSCLLFLSGAEVFDGLTWLRYAYHEGMCVYRSNYGALAVGARYRDDRVYARMLTDNVHYIQGLAVQMNTFLLEHDFSKFHHHSVFLRAQLDELRARLLQGGE